MIIPYFLIGIYAGYVQWKMEFGIIEIVVQGSGTSLVGHVDANHPDARQITTSIDSISTGIASLKKMASVWKPKPVKMIS